MRIMAIGYLLLMISLKGSVLMGGGQPRQPFYKNPRWLQTIRVSGLLQLWAWETRNRWWGEEWHITFQPQKGNNPHTGYRWKAGTLTPAEYLYYTYQPELQFYPPEVAQLLDRQVGRLSHRISIAPLDLIDAAIHFFQKYRFRSALDYHTLLVLTPRQLRLLSILWKQNFLTPAALYQQFSQQFPDEALVFAELKRDLKKLKQLKLVNFSSQGRFTYVMPRVSRSYFLYSLREAFRNVDALQHSGAYQHFKQLLQIMQGD